MTNAPGEPPPPPLPDLGPRYSIYGLIGTGGMGSVYRCFDQQLGWLVAVKIPAVRLANDLERLRFRREGQVLARFPRPRIVRLFDAALAGDAPYIIMELLEGETLATRLCAGPLPRSEVVLPLAGLLEGLEHVHSQGLIHRAMWSTPRC